MIGLGVQDRSHVYPLREYFFNLIKITVRLSLSQVIFKIANNEYGTSFGLSSTWGTGRWVFAFSSGVLSSSW